MNRDEFFEILKKSGIEIRHYELIKTIDEPIENDHIIKQFIDEIKYRQCAILGLDLYGYSKFEHDKQTLIPFVFDLIYKETIDNIADYEGCFFEGYSFVDNFISTGDGCFQIFQNPMQAFLFNINFFINLHTYNVFRFYPKFREYVGEFFFRSCITTGKTFTYEKNHYGPAIITNARILSRDRLNRFIIDDNTYKWFQKKIDGVANISEITLEELLTILDIYQDWGRTAIFKTNENPETEPPDKDNREYGGIKSCHVQKIGDISAKADKFSVYNLELQVNVYIFNPDIKEIGSRMLVTIGNNNISGIVD